MNWAMESLGKRVGERGYGERERGEDCEGGGERDGRESGMW